MLASSGLATPPGGVPRVFPFDAGDQRLSQKAIRANQEFFDLLAGDIFARLYQAFPEPIDLHSEGIFPTLGDQQEIDDNRNV
jgi:hypothetical protein